MRDFTDLLKIRHVVPRVSYGLNVHRLRLVVNGSFEVFGVVPFNKLGCYAQAWKEDLQLIIGSSVQVRCRDDIVTGVGKSRKSHELGRLTGGGGNGSDASLKGSNAFLEDIDCGLRGQTLAVLNEE